MMRQRVIVLIFFVVCFVCVGSAAAQSDTEKLLADGLAAYRQRDFRQAAALWEQASIPQNYMYYDIARAYEQMDGWGHARLNDLQAKAYTNRYFPWTQEPDLESALDRGWARQGIETLHPLIWLKQTLKEITRPIGWGVVGAALWLAFWITMIVFLRRRVGRGVLLVLGCGVLLWGLVIGANTVLDSAFIEAVSVEATPLYSGPGADYAALATWGEGYDLSIVEKRGDWARVWWADGMSGWVEQRLIREIDHFAEGGP